MSIALEISSGHGKAQIKVYLGLIPQIVIECLLCNKHFSKGAEGEKD